MRPDLERGDIVVIIGGYKPRPHLILGPSPTEGGLLYVALSSKDFGLLDLPVSSKGLHKPSWITPHIGLCYPQTDNGKPVAICRIDEASVQRIEERLLEFFFGHLLD